MADAQSSKSKGQKSTYALGIDLDALQQHQAHQQAAIAAGERTGYQDRLARLQAEEKAGQAQYATNLPGTGSGVRLPEFARGLNTTDETTGEKLGPWTSRMLTQDEVAQLNRIGGIRMRNANNRAEFRAIKQGYAIPSSDRANAGKTVPGLVKNGVLQQAMFVLYVTDERGRSLPESWYFTYADAFALYARHIEATVPDGIPQRNPLAAQPVAYALDRDGNPILRQLNDGTWIGVGVTHLLGHAVPLTGSDSLGNEFAFGAKRIFERQEYFDVLAGFARPESGLSKLWNEWFPKEALPQDLDDLRWISAQEVYRRGLFADSGLRFSRGRMAITTLHHYDAEGNDLGEIFTLEKVGMDFMPEYRLGGEDPATSKHPGGLTPAQARKNIHLYRAQFGELNSQAQAQGLYPARNAAPRLSAPQTAPAPAPAPVPLDELGPDEIPY